MAMSDWLGLLTATQKRKAINPSGYNPRAIELGSPEESIPAWEPDLGELSQFLEASQGQQESMPPPTPAADEFRAFLSKAPTRETHKPSTWDKIAGSLAGFSTGILGNAAGAGAANQARRNRKYDTAYGDFENRAKLLGEGAELETKGLRSLDEFYRGQRLDRKDTDMEADRQRRADLAENREERLARIAEERLELEKEESERKERDLLRKESKTNADIARTKRAGQVKVKDRYSTTGGIKTAYELALREVWTGYPEWEAFIKMDDYG